MSEWKTYKLGDVGKIITGKTPPTANLEYFGDKYPFITPRDMNTQKVILSTERYLSDTGKEYLKNNLLPKKSICVSCIGSDLGKVVVTSQESFTNQQLNSIVCSEKFDEDFIYYTCVQLSEQIRTIGKSSTAVPIVNKTSFSGFEFSAPKDKTTQTAIAQILTSLDDKIELNLQMNQTLEAMAQAIFKEWFVDFNFPGFDGDLVDGLPKGWRKEPIDKSIEFLNGLALQKYPPLSDDDFLPVIKIRELRQGVTNSSDKASTQIPEKYVIENGDILFSWSGSLEVVMWCNGQGALNQHLFKVSSEKYPKWFYYYWTKYFLPKYQATASDKATTMGHIQRRHLTESIINVPDFDLLNIANDILEPLLEKLKTNSLQIQSLTQTRDTLLPKLMSGQLEVV